MATPEQAVESLTNIFGRHPGCRAAHARGTICTGVFTPTAEAHDLTTAPHMKKAPTNVLVRFSNNSGDPDKPDFARQLRGMATRFDLAGGADTDIVAVTLPCFNARNPDDFVRMNRFFERRSHALWRMLAMLRLALYLPVRHREALRATVATFLFKRVPSYANCRYNSLHSFRWIDGLGKTRFVRYSWRPEEGERWISQSGARGLDRDYLQQDLQERLGRTPPRSISFRLELQLASVEDQRRNRLSDPTKVWPDRRETITTAGAGDRRPRFVNAGSLELTGLWEGPAMNETMPQFNPLPRVEGIEPSDDPTLMFRPSAYELSFRVRTAPGKAFPQ